MASSSDWAHPCALAIHTSSPDLGLALHRPSGEQRSQVWALGRDLSSQLHTYLPTFLAPHTWQELDWIAVAQGPGGFTGTRIGMVTARTLAQQLQIPLFAVSSLAAIAWQTWSTQALPTTVIAVQMPAQRGYLYGGIYAVQEAGQKAGQAWGDRSLTVVQPDAVWTPEAWQTHLEAQPEPYTLVVAADHLGHTVTAVLTLALQDWHAGQRPNWIEALPFYGQSPV